MADTYIKIWDTYESYFEPLSAAEVGRLVLAMMKYKSSGTEPELNGNERYVWPAVKRDLNKDAEYIEGKRISGKAGGSSSKRKQNEANASKTKLEKEKEKEKIRYRLRLVMRRQRRNLSRTSFERISGSSVPQGKGLWQNMLSAWVMNLCLL